MLSSDRLIRYFGFAVWLGCTCVTAQENRESSDAYRFAYVFNYEGEYLKLDLDTVGVIARWNLTAINHPVPVNRPVNVDNPHFIGSVQHIVAANNLSVTAGARSLGPYEYELILIDVPSMQIRATFREPGEDREPPAPIQAIDSNRFIVSWNKKTGKYLTVHDGSTFTKVETIHESRYSAERERVFREPFISYRSYLGEDGYFYWRKTRQRIDGQVLESEWRSLLQFANFDETERQKLWEFWGSPNPLWMLMPSSGRKLLMRARRLTSDEGILWVQDAITGETSPLFRVDHTRFRINSDGSLYLEPDSASETLTLYNVQSLERVGSVEKPPGHLVCESPDGKRQLYSDGEVWSVLRLKGDLGYTSVRVAGPFVRSDKCVFAFQ